MAKCHETASDEDRAISLLVPGWIKLAVATFIGMVGSTILAAGHWAWNMNATVMEMNAEIKSLNAITAERFAALKERLDRERREDRTTASNK